ncbi:MAG TPA: ACP S-malonyltransferase, partial [Cellvibrionaceae bacterium]|nr:ACP S-malonyltransferase [Cellvibrionaceae bacterium]
MSKSAFVFPGQGSQQVGMLAGLAAELPEVAQTFAESSEVLGYDLWQLVSEGPQERLNLTEQAQPALLTASIALWRAWLARSSFRPSFLAGHSLGEWSALVAAGVVSFTDAVRLVRLRGQYMQEAVPAGVGAMAAILGLDDAKVEQACRQASELGIVVPVNFNSPGQVVIAGENAAVDAAMASANELGASKTMLLPVSAPFHTAMMRPAAERLAKDLAAVAFAAPEIPVIHNLTARPEADPANLKALMIEQIYSPVRWVESIVYAVEQGVDTTVEVGPGRVLSGLNKRIHKGLTLLAT